MNSGMSSEDKVHLEVEEDENISGDEDTEMTVNQRKRKRYHRHSSQQIQAMESFFKECPHPDKKKRNELSQELGMEPLQVKFWFQNKRTQMKAKHQLQENARLMVENEKLRADNARYREALSTACCPTCGSMATTGDVLLDERHLRVENARLREEIDRISTVAANYIGKPFNNSPAIHSSSIHLATALGSGPFFKGSTSKANGSSDGEEF